MKIWIVLAGVLVAGCTSDGTFQVGSGGPSIRVESSCGRTTFVATGDTQAEAVTALRDDPTSLGFGEVVIVGPVTHVGRPFSGQLWIAFRTDATAVPEVMQVDGATDESSDLAIIDESCGFELQPRSD